MSKAISFCVLSIVAVGIFSISGCKGGGEIIPNIAPKTRLANIPPEGFISQNPRLTLYWVGDDPDGFVIAFRYRWSFRLNAGSPFQEKPYSTILNIQIDKGGGEKFALMTDADTAGVVVVYSYFATLPPEGIAADSATKLDAGDTLFFNGAYHVWASNPSTVRFPVHVNPNSGTFIFDSQDSLNPHTFEVAAIDNHGKLDDHPAIIDLQTPRVPPPHTQIISGPGPTDTVMVLDHVTDTFPGVEFDFQGFDPNSRTIEYSWVIDRDEWADSGISPIPWSPFSQTPSAFVNASNFPDRYHTRQHTLYVRARNEFGTIDTLGYFVNPRIVNGQIVGYDTTYSNQGFNIVYPSWFLPGYQQRILLINTDYSYSTDSSSSWNPTLDSTDQYYSSIMDNIGYAGKYDVVHPGKFGGFPGLGSLAQYRSVFLIADIIWDQSKLTETFIDPKVLYAYVNVGGRMLLTSYDLPYQLGASSYQGSSFMEYIAHCQDNSPRFAYAFIGASGLLGYPDVKLDTLKLRSNWNDALIYIWGGRPHGFGEKIYTFNDNGVSTLVSPFSYQGTTVGTRYIGLQYRTVYFGIPLWFCEKPTAALMIQKAFQDLGE